MWPGPRFRPSKPSEGRVLGFARAEDTRRRRSVKDFGCSSSSSDKCSAGRDVVEKVWATSDEKVCYGGECRLWGETGSVPSDPSSSQEGEATAGKQQQCAGLGNNCAGGIIPLQIAEDRIGQTSLGDKSIFVESVVFGDDVRVE